MGVEWKKRASQHVKVGLGGNPLLEKETSLNVLE